MRSRRSKSALINALVLSSAQIIDIIIYTIHRVDYDSTQLLLKGIRELHHRFMNRSKNPDGTPQQSCSSWQFPEPAQLHHKIPIATFLLIIFLRGTLFDNRCQEL